MVQQLVATGDLGVLEIHEVVLGECHVGDIFGEKKQTNKQKMFQVCNVQRLESSERRTFWLGPLEQGWLLSPLLLLKETQKAQIPSLPSPKKIASQEKQTWPLVDFYRIVPKI